MNRQRILASDNLFERIFTAMRAFLGQLLQKETWQALWHWLLWRVSPKRRRIQKLMQQLQPLDASAPAEMRALRDEVFAKSCLELQLLEEQQILLDILNKAQRPLGFEQVFLAAIYPILVQRDMEVIPLATEAEHRLDVEIGYLGHNEDYFFWVFEIDGTKRLTLETPLEPRLDVRDDKRYVVYPLGSVGLVETDFAAYAEQWLLDAPRLATALPILAAAYAEQWLLNARIYLAHILNDLKRRNYKVTATAIPDFERERLSLLRRLSLDRLKKRQSQSARQTR